VASSNVPAKNGQYISLDDICYRFILLLKSVTHRKDGSLEILSHCVLEEVAGAPKKRDDSSFVI
jgi:hypothetical protein